MREEGWGGVAWAEVVELAVCGLCRLWGGKSAVGLRALRACASLFVRNTLESFIPLVLAGIVKLCLCVNIA